MEVLVVVFVMFVALSVYLSIKNNEMSKKMKQIEADYRDYKANLDIQFNNRLYQEIAKAQNEATQASRRTIKGQLVEQLFPHMMDCEYHPADMRFLGDFCDYIVADGYTNTKDGDGDIERIVFVEIKTGKSRLSKHQQRIKKAVEEGRVEWSTVRLDL